MGVYYYVYDIHFRIIHFAKISDVQTAAMLCIAFGRYCQEISSRTSSFSTKSNTSVSFIFLQLSFPALVTINLHNLLHEKKVTVSGGSNDKESSGTLSFNFLRSSLTFSF